MADECLPNRRSIVFRQPGQFRKSLRGCIFMIFHAFSNLLCSRVSNFHRTSWRCPFIMDNLEHESLEEETNSSLGPGGSNADSSNPANTWQKIFKKPQKSKLRICWFARGNHAVSEEIRAGNHDKIFLL